MISAKFGLNVETVTPDNEELKDTIAALADFKSVKLLRKQNEENRQTSNM